VRVVIGEDEALLREGLMLVLKDAGIEVASVASDATELLELARAEAPDVVVADIRMPPANTDDGLRAALQIRRERPETSIMILSQYVHRQYAAELLDEGSSGVGYLLKQRIANAESFCSDLRQVAEGGTVLDPEVVGVMLARARREDDVIENLTPRQSQVLGLIAEGRSNAAIARSLVITEKAVVQHVSHIYDQLGLSPGGDDHRRVLAVVQYLSRAEPAPQGNAGRRPLRR
jgi:DNA-binding NarL/FixJ family response regulator